MVFPNKLRNPVTAKWPMGMAGMLVIALLASCGDPHTSPDAIVDGRPDRAATEPNQPTAKEILAAMIEKYRRAKTYSDTAFVQLTLNTPEGKHQEQLSIAVTFARPNRIRLARQDFLVISDGQKLWGKLLHLADQVVVAQAPEKIVVPDFYDNQAISLLMQPGIEGHSIQLDLLAADQPLKDLRQSHLKSRVLEPARHEGRDCHRLSFRTAAGDVVFWIDQENSILRRLEYPTDELKKSINAVVDEVTMIAEFRDAQLDLEIDPQVFFWKPAEKETQVRYFVPPPDPRLAPHPLLGQPAAQLTIHSSSGAKRQLADLQGKIIVIDFWATWCHFCMEAMPKFAAASQKFRDSQEVEFLAVSLDSPDVTDQDLAAQLQKSGLDVTWSRVAGADPLQTTLDAFQLEAIPAYCILDKQGRVQFVHEGGDLESDTKLPELVNKILAGEDLTRQAHQEWARLQKEYAQKLRLAQADEITDTVPIQRAEPKERQEPQDFLLSQLWNNSELKNPGNLMMGSGPQNEPQVVVVDGLHDIVLLNTQGKIIARHGEQLPEQAAISFLRRGQSDDGRPIYVAGGAGVPKFFVFDHQWKLLLAYPPEDTAQVYDVLPVDLDGDGGSELCVGYFNEAGVHAVRLDGQRLWRNRSVSSVSDLEAVSDGKEGPVQLLCAHSFGTLDWLDSQGQSLSPIRVANRAVTHVAVADSESDPDLQIAAVTIDPSQRRSLVGISRSGEMQWQHLLPPGEHESPIDMLAFGELVPGQPGYWLVATADGTLHIVSQDGQQIDRLATGRKLFGFTTGRFDDQGVLLISSDQGVTAYAVDKKDKKE